MHIAMIPKRATKHFKRGCEYKRVEVLCGLLREGDRVLDVGCGIGTYTSNPLSYLPIKITAIDFDQKTVEYSNKRNKRENLEFIVASGEYFYTDVRYDLIVCSHILEHTTEPQRLLFNMGRLLKDGGTLYLGVPNGYGAFEIQNFLPRMISKTKWGKGIINKMMGHAKDTLNADNPHINFFTGTSIRKLLTGTGWDVIEQINDEFLGGIVFDRIFSKLPSLAKWNVGVANKVPAQLADGWIYLCKIRRSAEEN